MNAPDTSPPTSLRATAPASPDAVAPEPQVARPGRLASIDLLRGLDVLLMLFVNEMAGVHGTPAWLLHVPAQADGMTITDTVFPGFLFITGLAIPLALGGRLARGEPRAAVWRHVLTRSAALVVIGVFMVNAEQGGTGGPLSLDLWNVMVTLAVLLAWRTPSRGEAGGRRTLLRAAGFAMLVALAFMYRGPGASGVLQMRTHWWGILGLIGWAYFVAATLYLLVGARPVVLACASMLLYGLYFVDRTVDVPWIAAWVDVGSVLGSHAALVLSGAVPAAALVRARERGAPIGRIAWCAFGYGAALVAAGVALHQFRDVSQAFWISKPMATPAWCLISGGLTSIAWSVLLFVSDVKGWRPWPRLVTAAGENALLVYLLAPLLASLIALSVPLAGGRNLYAELGRTLLVGTLRSVVFAWAVARLSVWMRARGLGLQI